MNTVNINGQDCKPLTIKGVAIPNYAVDPNGDIWSNKMGSWKKKKPTITPDNGGTNGYAKSSVQFNGEAINIFFHKVSCEAYVPFNRPSELSEEEWNITPQRVKDHIRDLYFVNHIDHDRSNYHPSNLEWVTSQDNAKAYQKHKNKKSDLVQEIQQDLAVESNSLEVFFA